MNVDDIKRTVLGNDRDEIVACFASLTAKQRSAIAKEIATFTRDLSDYPQFYGRKTRLDFKREIADLGFEMEKLRTRYYQGDHPALEVAIYATQSKTELLKRPLWCTNDDPYQHRDAWDNAILQALADRKVTWLDEFFANRIAADRRDGGAISIQMVLKAVEAGLIDQPDSPDYLTCLSQAMWSDNEPKSTLDRDRKLLLANHAFLTRDVYRLAPLDTDLFDQRERSSWTKLFIHLFSRKKIDRHQFLSSIIHTLFLDLKKNRAQALCRFLPELKIQPGELAQFASDFGRLLGNPHSFVAAMALKQLTELDKAGELNSKDVTQWLGAVATCPSKSTPKAAIKWLARLGKKEDTLVPIAIGSLVQILLHEDAEVQAEALKRLSDWSDRMHNDHATTLRQRIATLAPSNRAAATKLAAAVDGKSEAESAATPKPVLQKSPDSAVDTSVLADAVLEDPRSYPPVESIVDHAELIDAIAKALEHVETPEEAERILDAVSRLGPVPEGALSARAEPLIRRILDARGNSVRAMEGNSGLVNSPDSTPRMRRVIGLALGMKELLEKPWDIDEEDAKELGVPWPPEPQPFWLPTYETAYEIEDDMGPGYAFRALQYPWHARVMWQRLEAIEDCLNRGVHLPLLSCPTHEQGWVDPDALVDRLGIWQAADETPAEFDLFLALYRMMPSGRERALAASDSLAEPLRTVMAITCGGDCKKRKSDTSANSAWLAAAAHARIEQLDAACAKSLGVEPNYASGQLPFQLDWRFNERKTSASDRRIETVIVSEGECDWLHSHHAFSELHRIRYTDLHQASAWRLRMDAWNDQRNKDPYFLQGIRRLADRIERQASNYSPTSAFFEALFDASFQWSVAACGIAAIGLLGKDNDARTAAIDALDDAIPSARVSPVNMAASLRRVFVSPMCRMKRFCEAFATVAALGPAHSAFVSQSLEDLLIALACPERLPAADAPNRFAKPADICPALDLLNERLIESATPPSKELTEALSGVTAKGKVATSIGNLTSLRTD